MAVQSISSSSRILLVAVTTLALALLVSVVSAQAPDQVDYLAAHNAARSDVGVAPLVWSDAAYAVAASWSAGCVISHNDNRGSQYGENIAAGFDVTGTGLTAVGAVDLWVAEKVNYDHATNYCSGTCGHYTQVVWNTTTGVGCASADCGAADGIFHVCDYTPPGNYDGVPPY